MILLHGMPLFEDGMNKVADSSVGSVAARLAEAGHAFVAKQSKAGVEAILKSLGEVIYVTDVKVNPESRSLVTSSKALDFHTDHHKAKWILWHCLRQTDNGGESTLVDAAAAYWKLSASDQNALAQITLFEHKIFDDDEDRHPLVKMENGEPKFYYSFWLADKNLPPAQKKALFAFREAVASETPVIIRLEKGDVLVVNNRRILHGRCEIKGSRDRFLKRFWIQ